MDLGITHTYYTSGRCTDLELLPTPRTEQLVRNHRCTLRKRGDGVTLIASANSNRHLEIPFGDTPTLFFRLRMTDGTFPMFTDLEALGRQAAPLFTNAGGIAGPDLSLTSSEAWGTEKLVVSKSANDVAFVLAGRPAAGIAPQGFEVHGAQSVRVIGYSANERRIRLDTGSASPGQTLTLRYATQPALEWGVFANVEIHTAGVLPRAGEVAQNTPRQFRTALQAKRMKWAYYFVTDLAQGAGTLRIVDAARTGTKLAFGAANSTELNQAPHASDPIASQLAVRYPSLRRIRFVSDQPVACRQAPRKNIELHLNGARLYAALPNPSYHNYSSLESGGDVNAQRQGSLFEIVKHVANTFTTQGA
jgi:hypothetical protein